MRCSSCADREVRGSLPSLGASSILSQRAKILENSAEIAELGPPDGRSPAQGAEAGADRTGVPVGPGPRVAGHRPGVGRSRGVEEDTWDATSSRGHAR